MKVVVATPEARGGCPAHHALRMEGIPHERHGCNGVHGYGEVFHGLWAAGDPFVLVEYDIVPWPGAVQGMIDCPGGWCAHRYPLHRMPEGGTNLNAGFGFVKLRPTGPPLEEWLSTPWHLLDGAVIPVLNSRLGAPHIHEPPVAHARRVPI